MRKAAIFVCIIILSETSAVAADAKANANPPAWLALTKAYPARKDKVIEKYTHSKHTSTRLYAKALLDLSKRRFSSLPEDGKACLKAKPVSGVDATAYFGCMFAVATGLGIAGQTKRSFIWKARVIAFYKRHSQMINETTGTHSPANIKALSIPDVAAIKQWPEQTISVKKKWSYIQMRNGTVTAYINGKPIRMRVDTGSTGITISKTDSKRDGLASALIPLGVKSGALDNSDGYMTNWYYVKTFRVGPITILNAFVSDGPDSQTDLPGSAVGIDVLAALKKFSISETRISRFDANPELGNACGQMMFMRHGVTQAVTYPFLEVPTNIGPLGLVLDSGLHGFGEFRRIGVNLAPREKPKLTETGKIKLIKKNTIKVLLQNGKKVLWRTDIFPISIAGIRTQGSFQFSNPVDPMVAGTLVFNFLEKAKMTYDFPDRKMCIIPLEHSTSATSD